MGVLRSRTRRARDEHASRRTALSARVPYIALVRAPLEIAAVPPLENALRVGTYNVHRWAGVTGGRRLLPDLAAEVLRELDADVLALQEVLRPFAGRDPLVELADELGLHLAFAPTRVHRRGELGNAILARWPMTSVFTLDLSFGRLERRAAVAAEFRTLNGRPISIVSTHLALVDRTRRRQVRSILDHPQLQGAVVMLGDMNAWRNDAASRDLDAEFAERHHNEAWPASFPSARPVMALDRVYARGAVVRSLSVHQTVAARRGSDHLPVLASIEIENGA